MLADIVNLSVHGLFALLGTVLNIFTIVVIARGNKFARGMKIQLANLAVADLLCSLLTPGSGIVGGIVSLPYPNNLGLCKMQQYLTSVLFYSSLLSSAGISLERFVAVYFPLKMRNYQSWQIISVITAIWIVSFIVHIDSLMGNEVVLDSKHNNTLTCVSGRYLLMEDVYGAWMYIGVFRFLLPVTIIFISYGLICAKLVQLKRVGEKHKFDNQRKRFQVITMLAVDGILSVVTWIPYMIPILIPQLDRSNVDIDRWPEAYKMIFFSLMLTNCFTTPIIYLIFSKDFKADGKNILKSKCCSNNQNRSSITVIYTPEVKEISYKLNIEVYQR